MTENSAKDEASAPKAFISHNGANKDAARELSTALRANGVDAWFDEWEIRPGDSLVAMINRGLAEAQVFVVLLSPAALKSNWVGAELDYGIVAKIKGAARLVPIIVEACDVPPLLQPLKHLKWSDGLDSVVRELADVAFGRWDTRRPPVAAVRAAPSRSMASGLSDYAFELLKRLLPHALESSSEHVLCRDLLEGLSISETQLEDALEELEEAGCVKLSRHFGTGDPLDVGYVRAQFELISVAHRSGLLEFDPENDIERVLGRVATEGAVSCDSFGDLGIPVDRLNWAVEGIKVRGLAQVASGMQCGRDGVFTFAQINATRATRRWADQQ